MAYSDAVSKLNSLQSNSQTLQSIRKNRNVFYSNNVETMEKFLEKINVSQDDLKRLAIIHISGTKGKGSTCAYIESILNEYGYKVGFFSSPHLVLVRERIRINKKMISEELFTECFWELYNCLNEQLEEGEKMPAYFKFLTLLAMKIFIREKVDVAVMEVGIGGEFDCTNVVKYPVVCGITSLDLDHTSILGNTIESIAWHKSGIMKPNVPTFTVDQVFSNSFNVFVERSKKKQSPLIIAPSLDDYFTKHRHLNLGLKGPFQSMNASLALQISHYWMKRCVNGNVSNEGRASGFALNDQDVKALKTVSWAGRSQVVEKGNFTYYIDGAHTILSIYGCCDWFKQECNKKYFPKVLIFNTTGDRDPETLMKPLIDMNFNIAIFTTNIAWSNVDSSSDQKNVGVSDSHQMEKCKKIKQIWDSLVEEKNKNKSETESKCISVTFTYITNAIEWINDDQNRKILYKDLRPSAADKINILVTGSLHLVGGVLSVLEKVPL